VLKINNITLKFGGLIAVNNVSIEIKENEIYGLIGPNGAGKTTLFNIIDGVYKPTSGEIFLNNYRIDGLQPFQVNRLGIARTYQSTNLFKDMTVLENLLVGRHTKLKSGLLSSILRLPMQRREESESKEKSMELLELIGLTKKADFAAKHLSYGEQRLLEITRALASEPSILLLDEPAAGMNSKEKADLVDFIRQIRSSDMTILIVEHDMKVIMGITENICVLNYGKKIAEGDPVSIKNNPGVIKAYLGE